MPPKRRILYFSTQFPNQRSPSIGIFSLQRVLALSRAGCEVMVVSPLLMNPPPGMRTNPVQFYQWLRCQKKLPKETQIKGIPIYYPSWICPPKGIIGWRMSQFLYWQVRKTVRDLINVFHPEVILSSWLPDAVAAAEFASKMDVPLLSIVDGTDVNIWPDTYPGWNKARDIVNKHVDMLIFVSETLQSIGASKGLVGKENAVLHNAVDVHLFKPASSEGEDHLFTFLGIGRFVQMKGFHILLEAAGQLKSIANQSFRLTLIGDGPERKALMRQANSLGLQDSIELIAPMPHEKLINYYQKADVFCLPSFSEGFPCVVVEAMACGKPVVASQVGGVTEIVDDQSGIMVPPGDARALCNALLVATSRSWDSAAIRQKIVDSFSWEYWTGELFNLIKSIGNN